jgi:sugar/nucleoside kinase (ribokinase family)
MASDPGDLSWLDEVRSGAWLDGADWLFVSGYTLLRTPDPQRIVETAAVARAHGTRVAVDLSSAAMVAHFGADHFSSLCQGLRPSVVFATDSEWATSSGGFGAGGNAVLVLKHGERGASFVIDGVADDRPALDGPVVDVTGAGDALAAGFLVGGVQLGMAAAARCVAHRGAQPPDDEP